MKKSQTTPDKYKYMIEKLALRYHHSTGIDLDELIGEATLAFLEACHTFDTSKYVKLSTYTYTCIQNRLLSFIHEEMKWKNPGLEEIDMRYMSTNPTPFFVIFEQFSKDCQHIANMVLKNPTHYACQPPKLARGKVVKDLRKQGWSWPRIWSSIKNMKSTLNEIPQNCIIN